MLFKFILSIIRKHPLISPSLSNGVMISGYDVFSSHTSFDKSMKIGEISLSDKFEIKIREDPNIRIAASILIILATSASRTCRVAETINRDRLR